MHAVSLQCSIPEQSSEFRARRFSASAFYGSLTARPTALVELDSVIVNRQQLGDTHYGRRLLYNDLISFALPSDNPISKLRA